MDVYAMLNTASESLNLVVLNNVRKAYSQCLRCIQSWPNPSKMTFPTTSPTMSAMAILGLSNINLDICGTDFILIVFFILNSVFR
jgi:hypothetical protein